MKSKRKPKPFFSPGEQKKTGFDQAKFNEFKKWQFSVPVRNQNYSLKINLLASIFQGFFYGGLAYFFALVSGIELHGLLFFSTVGFLFGSLLGFIEEFWSMGAGYRHLISMLLFSTLFLSSIYMAEQVGWVSVRW